MSLLDDLTHILDQWDNTIPFGSQHTMISRMPAPNRGYGLVGGYGDLSWGHLLHPAINRCLYIIGRNPGPTRYCLMLARDFDEGGKYPFIRDLPRGHTTCPCIDGCHGNLTAEFHSQQLGDFRQRHAVLITQSVDTASQVTVRRAALCAPPGRGDADFDLAAMPFQRIDQVVQECVAHG